MDDASDNRHDRAGGGTSATDVSLAATTTDRRRESARDDVGREDVVITPTVLPTETSLDHWSRRQTTVLLNVATALNATGKLDTLMVTLAKLVAEAIDVQYTSVYAYDETLSRTVASGTFGLPGFDEALSDVAVLSPLDVPAEALVIQTCRTLYRTPETPFPDLVEVADVWSDLLVPLLADGTVQGVLYARQVGSIREFRTDEIALLEAIGSLAGLAIARARATEAAKRRADHLEVLNQLGRVLDATLDLPTLCQTIYTETCRIVTSDAFFIALYDEGSEWIWFPFLADRGKIVPQVWRPFGSGPTSQVITTQETLVLRRDDVELYQTGSHFGETEHSVECALFVPLISDNRLIGVLSVQRYDRDPYHDDERRTVETIAHQSAAALARARLFARIAEDRDAAERHASDLQAVLSVTHAIACAPDLDTMLETLADETRKLVPYDEFVLYRVSESASHLDPVLARGSGAVPTLLPLASDLGAIGRVYATGEPEVIGSCDLPERARSTDAPAGPEAETEGQHCEEFLVPLMVGDRVSGVLQLTRRGNRPFTPQEFTVVRILAEEAAAAIRNAELYSHNRDLYLAGIRALTSAVDAKDPYTCGHSERVSLLASRLAEALEEDPETIETVTLAGLLHDIGKIGVPDAILQKPGRLDAAEQAVMIRHSEIGADILVNSRTDALLPLAALVRHHHERFDGRGYPDNLAGDEIPLGARIIAVVDAYDTMVTDRPYRRRRATADAIAELRRCAGSQFDPRLVNVFIQSVLQCGPSLAGTQPNGTGLLVAPTGGPPLASPVDPAASQAGPGRLADARAVGLLVDLADLTRHITDLQSFMTMVVEMVRRRLDYETVYLLMADQQAQIFKRAAVSSTAAYDHGESYQQPLHTGLCGAVYRSGKPYNIVDVTREPLYHNPLPNVAKGSELVVPLIVDREVIGVLSVQSSRVAAFTSNDLMILTAVADQLAVAINVAQLHDAAKRAAATDGLTGLANHRCFYEELGEAIDRDEPFSVILFDVEGLKQVNDTAGHLAGDQLLREVAAALQTGVRTGDVVARYGGDEFGMILHGIGRREAVRVGTRIRREVSARVASLPVPVTVRFGVASMPVDGRRAIDLVAVADARMYEMRNITRSAAVDATPSPLPVDTARRPNSAEG